MSFDFQNLKAVNLPEKKDDAEKAVFWIRVDARNYNLTVSPDLGKKVLSDSEYLKIDQAELKETVNRKKRDSNNKKGFKLIKSEVEIDRHYLVLTGTKSKKGSSQAHWKLKKRKNGKAPESGIDNRPIHYSVTLSKPLLDEIDTKLSSQVKSTAWREFTVLEENIKGKSIAFDINDKSLISLKRKKPEDE